MINCKHINSLIGHNSKFLTDEGEPLLYMTSNSPKFEFVYPCLDLKEFNTLRTMYRLEKSYLAKKKKIERKTKRAGLDSSFGCPR